MTKKTLLVGLLAMFSVTTFAQNAAKKIKDARTNPDLYYLQDGQQTSSLELLPTPPQPGSIQFLYDEAQYQWGKMQRNTPRGTRLLPMHVLVETVCLTLSLKLLVSKSARKQHQRFISSC